jgi:hypothetical protein
MATQHVFYRGTDNHVHNIQLVGSWIHTDLTEKAGESGKVHALGDPFRYATTSEDGVNLLHVCYCSAERKAS